MSICSPPNESAGKGRIVVWNDPDMCVNEETGWKQKKSRIGPGQADA
jgi:hypothetical protein